MSLVDHAKRELEAIAAFGDGDFYGGMTGTAVMELVEVFAKQGHSGMSASIVRAMFHKLADFQPLSPLKGTDDEWNEIGNGTWQNVRCSRVFKDASGTYDINGKVFREPNGCCYTGKGSRVPVTFPYAPITEYIELEPNDS